MSPVTQTADVAAYRGKRNHQQAGAEGNERQVAHQEQISWMRAIKTVLNPGSHLPVNLFIRHQPGAESHEISTLGPSPV